jgi:hypothetical protein
MVAATLKPAGAGGLVLWGQQGQSFLPAAAMAKVSHGGHRSISEITDRFCMLLCLYLAINSALIIT